MDQSQIFFTSLDTPVIESKGMIEYMKLIELQLLPKIDTIFSEKDTIKGIIKSSEIETHPPIMRLGNTLSGEGNDIITTLNRRIATWPWSLQRTLYR